MGFIDTAMRPKWVVSKLACVLYCGLILWGVVAAVCHRYLRAIAMRPVALNYALGVYRRANKHAAGSVFDHASIASFLVGARAHVSSARTS